MEDIKYAGFWLRFGAFLIDLLVMAIVLYIPLTFIYGEDYWVGEQIVSGFWDIMLSYVVPFIATIWFWLRFMGTPGKMVLKLRVVDAATGNRMGAGQAIGRYFAYLVALIPIGLGFIWIAIDKRKQGWHDKLSGTVVVRDSAYEKLGK